MTFIFLNEVLHLLFIYNFIYNLYLKMFLIVLSN